MTELFENISDEVKEVARLGWNVALAQDSPIDASNFLNNLTNYYSDRYTEEEIAFLRFYFNMQLEMIKK